MTELEMMRITIATKKMKETIKESKERENKKYYALQIVRKLEKYEALKTIEMEISPFFIDPNLQRKNYLTKIKSVFKYTEELIKFLNSISELFEFELSYFIGSFVKKNETCIIGVNWKFNSKR